MRARRRGYRFGIAWVIDNDDLSWDEDYGSRPYDREAHARELSGVVSVSLLADLFSKPAIDVAHDIQRELERRGVLSIGSAPPGRFGAPGAS